MESDDVAPFHCPQCGAQIDGQPTACQNCRKWLGDEWRRRRERVPWRYDLASVMIFIVVFAVGLGLSLRAATAGIGVPILLFGPPTVIRVAPILIHRRREHRTDAFPGTATIILESASIVLFLVLAGAIAFVAVCFPVGLMTFNMGPAPYWWTAWVAGGLAACLAFYSLGRKTFPPRD